MGNIVQVLAVLTAALVLIGGLFVAFAEGCLIATLIRDFISLLRTTDKEL